MAKVNAAYEVAIQVARREFSKDTTRMALGLTSTLPVDETAWIARFDPLGQGIAPGGGPIYIKKPGGKDKSNTSTGAVQIKWNNKKSRVEILRPEYRSLTQFKASVSKDSVKFDAKK